MCEIYQLVLKHNFLTPLPLSVSFNGHLVVAVVEVVVVVAKKNHQPC